MLDGVDGTVQLLREDASTALVNIDGRFSVEDLEQSVGVVSAQLGPEPEAIGQPFQSLERRLMSGQDQGPLPSSIEGRPSVVEILLLDSGDGFEETDLLLRVLLLLVHEPSIEIDELSPVLTSDARTGHALEAVDHLHRPAGDMLVSRVDLDRLHDPGEGAVGRGEVLLNDLCRSEEQIDLIALVRRAGTLFVQDFEYFFPAPAGLRGSLDLTDDGGMVRTLGTRGEELVEGDGPVAARAEQDPGEPTSPVHLGVSLRLAVDQRFVHAYQAAVRAGAERVVVNRREQSRIGRIEGKTSEHRFQRPRVISDRAGVERADLLPPRSLLLVALCALGHLGVDSDELTGQTQTTSGIFDEAEHAGAFGELLEDVPVPLPGAIRILEMLFADLGARFEEPESFIFVTRRLVTGSNESEEPLPILDGDVKVFEGRDHIAAVRIQLEHPLVCPDRSRQVVELIAIPGSASQQKLCARAGILDQRELALRHLRGLVEVLFVGIDVTEHPESFAAFGIDLLEDAVEHLHGATGISEAAGQDARSLQHRVEATLGLLGHSLEPLQDLDELLEVFNRVEVDDQRFTRLDVVLLRQERLPRLRRLLGRSALREQSSDPT